jgi:hypothetical protein
MAFELDELAAALAAEPQPNGRIEALRFMLGLYLFRAESAEWGLEDGSVTAGEAADQAWAKLEKAIKAAHALTQAGALRAADTEAIDAALRRVHKLETRHIEAGIRLRAKHPARSRPTTARPRSHRSTVRRRTRTTARGPDREPEPEPPDVAAGRRT